MQIFGVSHKTIHNWIELNAYETWESLVSYVEKVFRDFGSNYTINFA